MAELKAWESTKALLSQELTTSVHYLIGCGKWRNTTHPSKIIQKFYQSAYWGSNESKTLATKSRTAFLKCRIGKLLRGPKVPMSGPRTRFSAINLKSRARKTHPLPLDGKGEAHLKAFTLSLTICFFQIMTTCYKASSIPRSRLTLFGRSTCLLG